MKFDFLYDSLKIHVIFDDFLTLLVPGSLLVVLLPVAQAHAAQGWQAVFRYFVSLLEIFLEVVCEWLELIFCIRLTIKETLACNIVLFYILFLISIRLGITLLRSEELGVVHLTQEVVCAGVRSD